MHFMTKSIKKQINFDIRKLHILLLHILRSHIFVHDVKSTPLFLVPVLISCKDSP